MPPGIYRTASGYRVVACISRTQRRERRFPPGTALRAMTRWQEDTRAALRKERQTRPGSLLADLETYMAARAAMPTRKARRHDLAAWFDALGADRSRHSVTPAEIQAQLERWRLGGWAPGTCNRARTALQSFYTVLNGKSGANPVRDVPKYREPRRPPKPLDYPTFERILAAMPDYGATVRGATRREVSQTKARLRVIAYTGLPHAQVKALQPAHIDWLQARVYILGRKKGDGTDDRWLPLSQAGLAALRAFAAASAWGPFSSSAMHASFLRGATKAGRPDLTPYDLRHLFGTTLLRATLNRAATRDLMLHTSDATTRRYVAAAIGDELRAALAAFDRDVVAPRCGSAEDVAGREPATPSETVS